MIKKSQVALVLSSMLCIGSAIAVETGAADTVLRVPTAGGRAQFGSDLKKIQVSGLSTAYSAKSADYTVAVTDDVIAVDASGGAKTMTLPAVASTPTGKVFTVKKTDSSLNYVIVDGNSSETIDGDTVYNLVAKNGFVKVQNTGSAWIIVNALNPWRVDANIGGANFDLGSANQSAYIGMANGSMTLTNNTSSLMSVLTAQIACNSTTPAEGTTCNTAAVLENNGISFSIPRAGDVRVCVSFTHAIDNSASSSVLVGFQIVETPNNAQTLSQLGKSRIQSRNSVASSSGFAPYTLCGTFSFSSSGQKTLRLMYEQDITNTPATNVIAADLESTTGQRDIHWEVYPLN